MFKYKLILLPTIILFSCGDMGENKEVIENDNTIEYNNVISHTDSLIVFADKKINKIRKNNKKQMLAMDSLQHTIEVEQYTINNLNREVERRIGVDETLELTRSQLEEALARCEAKEKKIQSIKEQLDLKSEKFMDEIEYYVNREVKLVTIYNNKIDSLEKKITLLERDVDIIDLIEENTNKKSKKRKNKKNGK